MTVEMVPTEINGRWTLNLPRHRAERAEWPWWERERLASMASAIEPGWTVVDVGAEEGDMPALFATWGARLILVEPNPRVWPNIRACFEGNGLPLPLACHVGFAAAVTGPGPHTGPEHIGETVRGGWPACAFGEVIGDHGFLMLHERPEVDRIRLDDLCDRVPVDAITIDVEGAELEVLRGAEAILRTERPVVWVSVHPEPMGVYGATPSDLFEFMGDLGYSSEFLAADHEEHWAFRPRST